MGFWRPLQIVEYAPRQFTISEKKDPIKLLSYFRIVAWALGMAFAFGVDSRNSGRFNCNRACRRNFKSRSRTKNQPKTTSTHIPNLHIATLIFTDSAEHFCCC